MHFDLQCKLRALIDNSNIPFEFKNYFTFLIKSNNNCVILSDYKAKVSNDESIKLIFALMVELICQNELVVHFNWLDNPKGIEQY